MSDKEPFPKFNSDMCSTPVCMAQTDDLIREIKKRYSTGAFVLLEPTPYSEEQLNTVFEDAKESGFITFSGKYHEITHDWGKHHLILGCLSRLLYEVNVSIKDCQTETPENEKF